MARFLSSSHSHRFKDSSQDYIPLDNSSIIYPPSEAKYNSIVFRLSAELKETVKPALLLQALNDILERLPYFKSRLREGFFWYFLTPNSAAPRIFEDGPRPCARIIKDASLDGYLFRVSYYSKRIAVDFFHALTDGGGGKTFLLSLIARYFEIQGKVIGSDPAIISCKTKPARWETEDQFQHLYRKVPFPASIRHSYHYCGLLSDRTFFVSGEAQLDSLKLAARKIGLTVNELFAAILVQIFLKKEEIEKKKAPIQLSIPIGLRPVYNLDTMRNFSLFAVVSIDPRLGPYTLAEIGKIIHLQMQMQVNTKELDRLVRRNLSGERNLFVRFVPNIIKKPFFKILSDMLGDSQYTMTVSNLGNIKIPSSMSNLIDRFDFFLAPNKKNVQECGVVGYKDKVVINFNSYLRDDVSVEQEFFSTLVKMGIPVKIWSNRRSD